VAKISSRTHFPIEAGKHDLKHDSQPCPYNHHFERHFQKQNQGKTNGELGKTGGFWGMGNGDTEYPNVVATIVCYRLFVACWTNRRPAGKPTQPT